MRAQALVALICGGLFGAGLIVSDMVNPGRILAFLDVTGAWDPSLAFVMGAALVPSVLAYAVRRRREAPVFEAKFHIPPPAGPDGRLVLGASIFGAGWGLVGLCPGPTVVGLVTGRWELALFAASMLAGFAAFRLTLDRPGPAPSQSSRS